MLWVLQHMFHGEIRKIFTGYPPLSRPMKMATNLPRISSPLDMGLKKVEIQGLGEAGLGGSVGCAVRLETRRSRVQPPPRSATFFCGD